MNVPTIPTFSDGDVPNARMSELSAAVQFLTVANDMPVWHYRKTATQATAANAYVDVTFGTADFDPDSTWQAGGVAQINTQGIYVTEACVPIQNNTAAFTMFLLFLFTAGAGNPNQAPGTQIHYGTTATEVIAGTANTQQGALCSSDFCPVTCYPGDNIRVQVWLTAAATLDKNTASSGGIGRLVPTFTGQWKRTGSLGHR